MPETKRREKRGLSFIIDKMHTSSTRNERKNMFLIEKGKGGGKRENTRKRGSHFL